MPRTKLASQIFGNPLRNRVTACRKRLRDNRGAHRQIQDTNSPAVETPKLAQFPADSPAVRQLATLDLSPVFGEQVNDAPESTGQEVGIT